MAEVVLEGVEKSFGKVAAVKDFNIQIHDKEFTVLVGPSGCGKSTLLRMVAGLEEVTKGRIYISGKLVNNLHSKDRDIAMVFQDYGLYSHMSVYNNMAFGLKLKKVPKAEIEQVIMKGFFENITASSEETALFDGCSYWGGLKMAVPQVLPGIFALSLIGWLWTWNELLFAMLLTSANTPLLTVTIVQFINEIGMDWNLMAASAVIALLPVIVITIFRQRYITKGLYM